MKKQIATLLVLFSTLSMQSHATFDAFFDETDKVKKVCILKAEDASLAFKVEAEKLLLGSDLPAKFIVEVFDTSRKTCLKAYLSSMDGQSREFFKYELQSIREGLDKNINGSGEWKKKYIDIYMDMITKMTDVGISLYEEEVAQHAKNNN